MIINNTFELSISMQEDEPPGEPAIEKGSAGASPSQKREKVIYNHLGQVFKGM